MIIASLVLVSHNIHTMKIQILSDIHLERRSLGFDAIVNTIGNADVLVLAGDIGCPTSLVYHQFLQFCNQRFKHVIVVCGNHEYRSCMTTHTFLEVDQHVKALCNSITITSNSVGPGHAVHYLNTGQNVVIDGRVNFIGATLWSRIPSCVAQHHVDAINASFHGMKIDTNTPFTVTAMNNEFDAHLAGIQCAINDGYVRNMKNVIVTHHAPILKTMYRVEEYPVNYLYGSDLEDALDYRYIHTWVYGHTHWNIIHNMRGTLCITNQYGHDVEPLRGWSDSCVIRV